MTDADHERWEQYAAAILHIEVEPGTWVALNGPSAVDQLPLGSPLFLLTAWDPFGEKRSAEANAKANSLMEAELRSVCKLVARAVGRDARTGYGEDGFAVAGGGLAEVVDVARRFRQEAIYQVVDDTIRILPCSGEGGDAVGLPRRR